MQPFPAVARVAAIIAFLIAAGAAIEALLGAIVILPLALIPLASGIGIMRRRAWSAWGYAMVQIAQLLILPAIVWGPAGSQMSLETLRTVVAATMFGPGIAVLYWFAGQSLAATGAPRGHAAPWAAVSLAVTVPLIFVHAYVVPTGSMEDTLLVGDRILVRKLPAPEPRLGEVMALAYPIDRKQTFIKRIVGMPGDRIRIANKVLYRNGVQAVESWAVHKMDYEDAYRDNFPSEPSVPVFPQAAEMLTENVLNGELVVPPGKYFVMGDNRDQSLDSRYWGFVSKSDFIGRPVMIYDSVEQSTEGAEGGKLFPRGHRRWNRLFRLL